MGQVAPYYDMSRVNMQLETDFPDMGQVAPYLGDSWHGP